MINQKEYLGNILIFSWEKIGDKIDSCASSKTLEFANKSNEPIERKNTIGSN